MKTYDLNIPAFFPLTCQMALMRKGGIEDIVISISYENFGLSSYKDI